MERRIWNQTPPRCGFPFVKNNFIYSKREGRLSALVNSQYHQLLRVRYLQMFEKMSYNTFLCVSCPCEPACVGSFSWVAFSFLSDGAAGDGGGGGASSDIVCTIGIKIYDTVCKPTPARFWPFFTVVHSNIETYTFPILLIFVSRSYITTTPEGIQEEHKARLYTIYFYACTFILQRKTIFGVSHALSAAE